MADGLAAARGPVTRLPLDTDHNNLFAAGGPQLRPAVARFLDAVA